jgi:hypothetical protein
MNDAHNNSSNSGAQHSTHGQGGVVSPAVLGQVQSPDGHDIAVQAAEDVHWTAKKICAHLKVTSALMTAIIISPGGESGDLEIAAATKLIIDQAAELATAAEALIRVPPEQKQYAAFKNMLRQQTIEVVSAQWRLSNGAGKKSLSVDQMASIFKAIVDFKPFENEGEVPSLPSDVDTTTAQRVSMLAVAPEIHHAVNSFDYFHPNPEILVERAFRAVLEVAQSGLAKLLGDQAGPQTAAMVSQSLIGKAGSLYAANYLAIARKDVGALQAMSSEERTRRIHVYRPTGLPMEHVDDAFRRLAHRMINMVCESVPEVAAKARRAPVASLPEDLQASLLQIAQAARPDLSGEVIMSSEIDVAERDVAPFYRQVMTWRPAQYEERGEQHVLTLQAAYERDRASVPPIMVDTDRVRDGRARLIALQRMGAEKVQTIDSAQWLATMPFPEKTYQPNVESDNELG